MKNNLLFVSIAILFFGCNQNDIQLKPKACFDYSPTKNIKTIDTIKFSNYSENSSYYYWDFGDGTTSLEKEPMHKYNSKGSYIVKLKASDKLYTDSIFKNINITDTVSLNNQALGQNPYFYLDVDGNSINDFVLFYAVWGGHTGSWADSFIIPSNDYEISIKKYCYGDTIFLDNTDFTNQKTSITSTYYLWSLKSSQNSSDFWDKNNFGYLAFRKKVDNKTLIGWIKLKATSSIKVNLISFRIPTEITERLIIDE